MKKFINYLHKNNWSEIMANGSSYSKIHSMYWLDIKKRNGFYSLTNCNSTCQDSIVRKKYSNLKIGNHYQETFKFRTIWGLKRKLIQLKLGYSFIDVLKRYLNSIA